MRSGAVAEAWMTNCTFHLNEKGGWGGAYYYETDDNHETNNNPFGLRPIKNGIFRSNGNQVTGTTSDPLTYTAQGTCSITWTFNDGNGNSETATQTVIVDDVTKPVKPTLANATAECSVTVTKRTNPRRFSRVIDLRF